MLYDYECRVCGARMDDYLHRRSDTPSGEPPDAFDCPECRGSRTLARTTVYRNATLGPVWEGLDRWNASLFSAKERRAGKEIRTAKDIERWEASKGFARPSSTEERVWRDESLHDGALIKKAQESGAAAALDYVDTTEIMAASGMTKAETEQWKVRTNAASATISARDFEPSTT